MCVVGGEGVGQILEMIRKPSRDTLRAPSSKTDQMVVTFIGKF